MSEKSASHLRFGKEGDSDRQRIVNLHELGLLPKKVLDTVPPSNERSMLTVNLPPSHRFSVCFAWHRVSYSIHLDIPPKHRGESSSQTCRQMSVADHLCSNHLDNSYNVALNKTSRLPYSSQASYSNPAPKSDHSRHGSKGSSVAGGKKEKKEKGSRKLTTPSWHQPHHSNGVQTSFSWRSGHPMAGMLELERSRTRRERTFIGSECAVCEEPLEHTLRGERILQFSCGHVSHEACFYEYIKEFESQYCPTCNAPLGLDTSRGGNVLDLGRDYVYPSHMI